MWKKIKLYVGLNKTSEIVMRRRRRMNSYSYTDIYKNTHRNLSWCHSLVEDDTGTGENREVRERERDGREMCLWK